MPIHAISAPTLKAWLDSDEAVLIDVRQPTEYAAEHIPGSVPVPLATVSTTRLPRHDGKKIVLQCRSGARSSAACRALQKEMPHADLYNLSGGITAWTQAGFPVEGTGRAVLPLDRQVQLTIGLCVLAGSVLAYFVSPLFLLLTGFFGLGLSFAGVTGFCGLARLMALAPWNQAG